jgi:hypothetical protein
MSAEKLLEQAWDENADPFTKTVQVTIGRLRRKLGDPNIIRTTPGMGYRISPTGQADPLAQTKLERPHRHSRAPHTRTVTTSGSNTNRRLAAPLIRAVTKARQPSTTAAGLATRARTRPGLPRDDVRKGLVGETVPVADPASRSAQTA